MPLSFGKLGKAIAILVIAAFVLWLIFTYFFATEEVAEEVAPTGAVDVVGDPVA
ncbi:MAG: hypothetical protein ACRECX_10265 [Methyloceanibacter sp.]|uniref:hypothetical protein n=1 Tax=Methyloceanibacter sp. TaxID=1965321 RepID=UPI003D6D7985